MNTSTIKHLSFLLISGLLWTIHIPSASAFTQETLQNVSAYFPEIGPNNVEEASLDTNEICEPGYDAGTFTIRTRFENTSTNVTLGGLVFEIDEISDTATICNAYSASGGRRALLVVAPEDGYANGSLEPGEYFEQTFTIGLAELTPFTLIVNLLGIVDSDSPITLHQHTGEILNAMSGLNLIAHADKVSDKLKQAIDAATLQEVIGPTETVEQDPSAFHPTEITTTQWIYQCNDGGTLERTETTSFTGTYERNTAIESDLYSADNCKTRITDSQSVSYSLDGSFEQVDRGRIGNREDESTITHTWLAHRLTEDSQGSRQSFTTDAQLQASRYGSQLTLRTGRSLTIAEFEQWINDESVERLESVTYRQGQDDRSGSSGVITETLWVSGIYTGPLSDDYQVSVSADPGLLASNSDDPATQDLEAAASGSFSLNSGNGDFLLIDVLPVPPVDNFYLADYKSTRADGSTVDLPSVPFFRYTIDNKPFAVMLH